MAVICVALPVRPGLVRIQQKTLSAIIENNTLRDDLPYTGTVQDLVPLAVFLAIDKDSASRWLVRIDVKIQVQWDTRQGALQKEIPCGRQLRCIRRSCFRWGCGRRLG
jgi:hypothetical protein